MAQKLKISESEILKLIKEEYSKKITEIKLKNRLKQINEEMSSIMTKDENIDEVSTDGKTHATKSTTGLENGTQYNVKFQNEGSHHQEVI